jgi:hypothetical protein
MFALGGAASLVEHDRLARRDLARSVEERLAILEALDVHHHGARVRIVAEELKIFVEAHVAFIPYSDEGSEACMPVVMALRQQRKRNVPRLRQYAEASCIDSRPSYEIAAGVAVEHAVGVWTNQANSVAPRCFHCARLQQRTLGARLAEAAREHQRALHIFASAVFHDIRNGAGRRADKRQIDIDRNCQELRIARQPEDFGFPGIDRNNPPLVARIQERLDGAIAALGGVA